MALLAASGGIIPQGCVAHYHPAPQMVANRGRQDGGFASASSGRARHRGRHRIYVDHESDLEDSEKVARS